MAERDDDHLEDDAQVEDVRIGSVPISETRVSIMDWV